jgi:glyoxylase-like metal-dependent hydrolase (beta-lactamase superfamily II)
MADDIRMLRIGAATVCLINVGDLGAQLADWIKVPEDERPPEYAPYFAEPLRIPTQCMLIQLDGVSTLVDAGAYDPDSNYRLPAYQPPPDIPAQLATLGVQPEDVARVIITHAHWDHYNGATILQDKRYAPTFPNARYYLGRADWEDATIQIGLQDATSLPGRTLAVLRREGLLELVHGDRDLGGGIRIIASPGESPGHQIVRVESEDEVLYCVGDLFHHVVEIEQPDWIVPWADPHAMGASRKALMQDALAEGAVLIATHIRGAGRLQRAAVGAGWVSV